MLVLLRVAVLIVVLPWLGIRLESFRDLDEKQEDVHFPYVVSIQILASSEKSVTVDFYAAGALVSDKQALSSCHKFLKTDKYWQDGGALLVVAGASKLVGNHSFESDDAQMRHVDRVDRHPKCGSKIPHIYGFDAAILTLKKPMQLNKHVQPIAVKFNDLRAMEQELVKMEKKRVVCSTFRWAWIVKEEPILIGTDTTSKMVTRMKRSANDSTAGNGTSTTPGKTTSTTRATTKSVTPGNMTGGSTTDDFPSVTGNMAIIKSYSEISVNKVLIASNEVCKKAFCKAGQPACAHDFGANGQFCTTPWEISNNTCLDTGGPLVCGGYLFGILNFEMCLLQRTPAVYAGPKTIIELLVKKPTTAVPISTKSSAKTPTTAFLMSIFLAALGTVTSQWY